MVAVPCFRGASEMKAPNVLFAAVMLAAGLSSGCQVVMGYEDFEAATSGSGNDGGGDPCADAKLPSVEGTVMIATPREDGTCFWMDEHEVTQEQYAEFANNN